MSYTKTFTTLFSALALVFTVGSTSLLVGCGSTAKQESTGEYVDDSVITAKVKAALVKDPDLSAAEINVETYKGTVQLSGFVKQAEDVSKASTLVRSIKGVSAVKNNLIVK